MSLQEFPWVRLKGIQVKGSTEDYQLWDVLPAETLVLLNLLTHVKNRICSHGSVRVGQVTLNLPGGYLTQPLRTDRPLRHAPSEPEFLLPRGIHCKQLSTQQQLGHRTSFSPTVWLKAGTVGFLNPRLC